MRLKRITGFFQHASRKAVSALGLAFQKVNSAQIVELDCKQVISA
jgi:hypothetical protein